MDLSRPTKRRTISCHLTQTTQSTWTNCICSLFIDKRLRSLSQNAEVYTSVFTFRPDEGGMYTSSTVIFRLGGLEISTFTEHGGST